MYQTAETQDIKVRIEQVKPKKTLWGKKTIDYFFFKCNYYVISPKRGLFSLNILFGATNIQVQTYYSQKIVPMHSEKVVIKGWTIFYELHTNRKYFSGEISYIF